MTKYSFLRLRLLRTIREWICSANMIDIEHFTKIFYSLGEIDRSIVKKIDTRRFYKKHLPMSRLFRVLYLRKDIQISQENTKSFSSREGTRFRLNPASADLLYNDRLGTDNNKAADL